MRACHPEDVKTREWRSAWKRERERERKHARGGERERKRFGSSFYMFFPPPGPALCKLGLARSAVCSTRGLHSSPLTFLCSTFPGFSLPCLLATAILDSFSLFYLPNKVNQRFIRGSACEIKPYNIHKKNPGKDFLVKGWRYLVMASKIEKTHCQTP